MDRFIANYNNNLETVLITFENGTSLNCSVLSIFNVDAKNYIALDKELMDIEYCDYVYIYKLIENDENFLLEAIENFTEYEKAKLILTKKAYEEFYNFVLDDLTGKELDNYVNDALNNLITLSEIDNFYQTIEGFYEA